ncbi:helix-turn-helix domain-containing protein [Croceibacterium xixiisoli]|nr:XRE family transcriptional regulator [Croceibacterium xixiisoli]
MIEADADSSSHDSRMIADPAAALRALRAAKGWTLADVKDRTGMSISTLSKLENGKMGLSYDKLLKLGHGLGVDIAQLLSGGEIVRGEIVRGETGAMFPFNGAGLQPGGAPQLVSGRRSITRKGEEKNIGTPFYDYACHAPELLNRSIHPMLVDVKARSIEDFPEFTRHAGEEFSYVVDGIIEFHCDLYAPVLLHEGDSIYFDAGMGHAYIAAAPGRCRIMSVCTSIPHV